jgi:hypothetical protein
MITDVKAVNNAGEEIWLKVNMTLGNNLEIINGVICIKKPKPILTLIKNESSEK